MRLLLSLTLEDSWDFDKCQSVATILFAIMAARHGQEKTRRMFAVFGPLNADNFKTFREIEIASEISRMPEPPNIHKLAATLAEKNEGMPWGERYGPRGSTNAETMRRYINRLLANSEFCKKLETLRRLRNDLKI